ncbi:hypothetical protein [Asaia bogorensis]|nr:hypothetical protein [Asaia bogorensis]
MSDLFPMLSPETHKPELMAGTSTLSYGGGMASPPSEVGVGMADAGRAAEAASFAGGMSHDVITQLDLIQARAASIVELTARLGISAAQSGSNPSILREGSVETENAAGQAVAALLGMNGTPSSATQVGQQDALPKLQFLSAETAIQAVSPVVANQRAENELSSSAKSEAAPLPPSATSIPSPDAPTSLWDLEEDQQESDQTPHSRLVRSTGYTYDPSNGAFNGSYDYTPGGVINDYPSIDWNFLGGGGGGYVPLPTHGSTPDSGPPIPPYKPGDTGERIRTVEEIKQQALEIYGVEANENHIHFVQIQQRKLVPWDSLRNWLAHDDVAKNALVKVIEQTQGRPYDARDDEWIAVHQNEIGIDGKSLLQVRQELARWTAEHGGYDALYRHAHNRAPTEADRAYAATMIGNGWTAKDYLWNEIHGEAAAREYADTYRQVHGREPSAADIQFAQQKISDGASLQRYRWDEAHSDAVANQLREIVSTTQGRSYQDGDAAWVRARQDDLGNGNQTPAQIRQSIARWTADNGGYDATFQAVHGRAPGAGDRNYAATQIGNGWSVADYRWNEAHSVSAAQDYRVMFRNVAGKDPGDGDVQWLQNAVANGSNYVTLRQNLAWSDWGHDAVRNVYAQTAGIQNPTQVQYDVYQRELANGANVADITRKLAYSWEGHDAVRNVYARTAGIQNPTQVQYDVYQRELANGANVADITRKLAYSWEGHDAVRNVYARTAGIQNPTQVQYDVYQRELANGASVADITRKLAYSWEGHDAVQKAFARTAGIQNPTQSQYDWYQRALATGSSTLDITGGIARAWEGESAVRKAYTEAGGITPNDDQIRSWVNGLAQGTSYTDMRGTIAHNEGSVALKDIALKVLGRTISPEELATQQAELTNGRSIEEIRRNIIASPEAETHIRIFLAQDIGQITDQLIADGRTTLSHVTQAYQTLKTESTETLSNMANAYRNTYGNGSLLQSLMPHTWQDWLNLTATVMLFTPLGPEELAVEGAIIGGEKLLSAVFNVEERAAALSLESSGAAAILPESATGALDELATFLPKQEGRTLALDENTTVTQFAKPEGPNSLHFSGSNDQAVKSYFEKITGADKNPGLLGHRELPGGKEVYFIKTAKGEFRLRSKSTSSAKGGLDKWTIDLPRGLLNPAKPWLMEIKFY